ncbi:MFS transporter [Ramlibacter sp. G-1-2-2]|uniref:MFS transporter n=1 Tax=Ramlibacter agri TaxID=2728837 RepID=A0A848H1N3_9BURK|nr:MFS transporter [Ramlibacter agri]NML44896.1 MFS transporter [Ramlibacter agri]
MTDLAAPRRQAMWLVLLAAGGTFALSMGSRQSMGLFLSYLNTSTHLGVAAISLAFAFGQLWWGLTQPIAGAIADRWGPGRVLVAGTLLAALGSFIAPYMTTTLGLIFAIGVLAAGGSGLAGPAVLVAATMRRIDDNQRGMATGVVNACGSLGQFAVAPLAGFWIASLGWVTAMQAVGLIVLLALPAAWVLRRTGDASAPAAASAAKPQGTKAAVAAACRHPGYLLLTAGFFVCGFHVALLVIHLPGMVAACGLPPQWGGWALAMLGLFNIVGSLAIGWATQRWRMKSLLALLYAARAVFVLAFLFAPKTGPVVLLFAAVMGLTYLATVPPTAGLVAKFFGSAHMATLFGLVMLVHQVGAFAGTWLGGKVFEWTGGYDWVWYIDIVLAVGAALVHLPIREAPVAPLGRPAAA